MEFYYEANFNLKKCMEALGVDERGKVEEIVANEILRGTDKYVPFDEGMLKGSGRVSQGTNGTYVEWNTPYAHYQWAGIVYAYPDSDKAGYKTDKGWQSRKGVEKIPTNRKLTYRGNKERGPRWVNRMLRNGGREEIEQAAREAAKR